MAHYIIALFQVERAQTRFNVFESLKMSKNMVKDKLNFVYIKNQYRSDMNYFPLHTRSRKAIDKSDRQAFNKDVFVSIIRIV